MDGRTILVKGKQTATFTPAGDKVVIVLVFDTPDTLGEMIHLRNIGFKERSKTEE